MARQDGIRRKLEAGLDPVHLEVINESGRHNVPPGSETHFKVVVVSDRFTGSSLLARHRAVYGLLDEELRNGVHALSVQAFTPSEWEKNGTRPSPPCLGGEKGEPEPAG